MLPFVNYAEHSVMKEKQKEVKLHYLVSKNYAQLEELDCIETAWNGVNTI